MSTSTRRYGAPTPSRVMALTLFLTFAPAIDVTAAEPQAVYQSVDHFGNVIYSDTPLPGTSSRTIDVPPAPAGAQDGQSPRHASQMQQNSEQRSGVSARQNNPHGREAIQPPHRPILQSERYSPQQSVDNGYPINPRDPQHRGFQGRNAAPAPGNRGDNPAYWPTPDYRAGGSWQSPTLRQPSMRIGGSSAR